MLGDIDVEVECLDIEDCHRIRKPYKANSKNNDCTLCKQKILQKNIKYKNNWTNVLVLTLTLTYLSMKT